MGALLDIRDLRVEFHTENGVVRAVNGLSYKLKAGETLGVVGESGCGKSVHALSIMRLIPSPPGRIVGGKIWFDGRDIMCLSNREMQQVRGKDIGMVFQDPMVSLNPVYKVGDQISEALKIHQKLDDTQARERATELLNMVGIPEAQVRLDDYPHQFSGGMRQRAIIAIALSCNPKLLIADEPTTALDVTIQAQIVDLVKNLQNQLGMSVIWITHDLGVAAGIADQINVMYAGFIVERGISREIYKHPRHPYTQGLLASLPRIDEPRGTRLDSIPGLPPDLLALPTGCPFAARCPIAVEKCADQMPPLEPTVHPDHTVACWQWEEANVEGGNLYKAWGLEVKQPIEDKTVINGKSVLVHVSKLKKYFPIRRGTIFQRHVGDIKAVDEVTFDILKGETLGLVGETGSGKTTVGRTLLRLYEPTSGEVSFAGKDIMALSANEMRTLRRRMQIIFQDPYASLNPRMKVKAIVGEPLLVHEGLRGKQKNERVQELLQLVGIDAKMLDRYPHEFSGGQRQRIGIARALTLNPDLIVCDEPIASLDVSIQAQVVNLLEDLQDQLGLTYLFIAHDLSMVRHISNRIAVIYLGKIVELADRDEIFQEPLHPYTQALISAVPVADPDVEKNRQRIILEGDLPSPANPPKGCNFNTRCPHANEICFDKEPSYIEYQPGHFVACHLIDGG